MVESGGWMEANPLADWRESIQRIISHFLTIEPPVHQEGAELLRFASDVKHGITRVACEGFHGDGIERMGEGAGNLAPRAVDAQAGVALPGDGRLEQRRVYRLDDLAQGDEVGGSTEEVSAGLAAAALDESGAAQVVEDLDEEISGDDFALREVFETCKGSPVMELCELGHRPAGIFQFLRDFHE